MKLIIEGRDKGHNEKIERLTQELKDLLAGQGTVKDQATLLALAESLLVYSHSHSLLKLSPRQLLDWLQVFRAFLARRQAMVNVTCFSPTGHDHAYLLINTPDVPYLVDSLQMLFQRLQVRAVIISHPILAVERQDGTLVSLAHGRNRNALESFMLVKIDRDQADPDGLVQQVRQSVELVQCVGQQRLHLKDRLAGLGKQLASQEQADFHAWLLQDNFTSFGYVAIDFAGQDKSTVALVGDGPVGWVPEELLAGIRRAGKPAALPAVHLLRLQRDNDLVVEVMEQTSLLHRAEPLVYLGFREQVDGGSWREHAFIGLFSQNSLNELAFNVPPLKAKLQAAFDRQHLLRDSYDYRKALEILNTFPKVELFFLSERELDLLVRSLISLQRYQSVKVVITRSLSLSGITLMIIMPRDFYSSATVRRLETYLGRYFKARRVDSRVMHFYSEYLSLHVRLVPKNIRVKVDIDRLEKMLTSLARPWGERLHYLLQREHGTAHGYRLWRKYLDGLPGEYRALIHPRFAIRDIRLMERVLADGEEIFDLWGPFQERRDVFRLQFYSLRECYLNELMPYLENLNLTVADEVDFNVAVDGRTLFIKSFTVHNDQPQAMPLSANREKLLETLIGLRRGSIEDDYLNRLLVLTGLDWKQIDVFRAYRNYYFQLGNPFTKRRVAFALINNPQVALLLYRYFESRFLPKPEWDDLLLREEQALMPVRVELAQVLEQVRDINEDRILRSLFNLIDSTVRTNFFLRRDDPDYFLSFKISAIGIIDMPFPRPMYETYVHSSTMEGIHLRGGRVARGGIRWSDRPDDFRTEVLGLMKTQMTKNALIVPVGSKGGFVVKTPFTTREEGGELSRQAYITLMRGLLDLVDNRVAGKVVRPRGVVVYDEPDPYLVVAADKGTAHLPDTANSVSLDYGFWLGDAFASGGSVGYDHKKLGITARGAWECVKRHFRELGKDIQNEYFTAIGIGDMSGDVFGNGMLLSKHTRLLAAFNHMHIFIDPDPDPAASWEERRRLFDMPRSTWGDYDPALISRGGGVWPRSAKEIPLSPEVRDWLGVRHTSMEGDELVRRILAADVELLWNGGIGTYVKATSEKHGEVGDRANDNVRINAGQLKALVVGEGGNLGMTQKARIEYALAGGRLNTDAIDNSAGVDTSDHEVNLKILFQTLRELAIIKTERTRNKLLSDIQDEVCGDVLQNNYMQSLCLSLDVLRCREDVEPFIDLSDRLANAGLLDRQSEFLPTRKELTARGTGYARPELAILLSYSKMHLYQALLDSDLPDREPVQAFLGEYFPALLTRKFGQHLQRHPLRREIIATMITNRVIGQAGCAFLNTLSRQTGASPVQGVAAYLVFDEVLGGTGIRKQIFSCDNRLPAERQYALLLSLETTLAGLCSQVVEQALPMTLDQDCVDDYRERLKLFRTHLRELLSTEEWQACQDEAATLVADGLVDEQAQVMASFRYLVGFLPAVHIAKSSDADLFAVTDVMNSLNKRLRLSVVNACLDEFMVHDRWDRMALSSLRSSFLRQFVRLTTMIVNQGGNVAGYLGERRQKVDIFVGLVESFKASQPTSTSPFMVLLRAMEALSD